MSNRTLAAQAARHGAYQKAEDISTRLHRLRLILKGIDRIAIDQLERTRPLQEGAEIVLELINVSMAMVEETCNAAEELTGELSGVAL